MLKRKKARSSSARKQRAKDITTAKAVKALTDAAYKRLRDLGKYANGLPVAPVQASHFKKPSNAAVFGVITSLSRTVRTVGKYDSLYGALFQGLMDGFNRHLAP